MPNSHQHSEEGGRFSGGRSACKRGCANPRQPGSSPIGPSRGLIRRIANTRSTDDNGLNCDIEGVRTTTG